jgi:hypothetical protein
VNAVRGALAELHPALLKKLQPDDFNKNYPTSRHCETVCKTFNTTIDIALHFTFNPGGDAKSVLQQVW